MAEIIVFLVVQANCASRFLRKPYRTFRINIVRDHDHAANESKRVWFQILRGQLLFLLFWPFLLAAVNRLFVDLSPSAGIPFVWTFFLLGPHAIEKAMTARYNGFRLQALSHLPVSQERSIWHT